MTQQKLKRFHVKRIYSTLLLSYGALLAAPFIAVFLLLSFWKNSTENYYSEIMKNDLTEGRMAFEKQLDIMCAGAFSVSNDSDLKWVYFLDGLKDGDNNIAALIRCNDMLRQTFADSEHYQNYSVIMKNELIFRKSGMVVGDKFFYDNYCTYQNTDFETWRKQSFEADTWQLFPLEEIDTGEETLQAMTFSYPVRNYIQQEQEANAVVQFLLSKENLEQMFGQLLSRQGGILIYDAEDRLLASLGKINADGDDPENTDLFLSEATGEDIRQIKWNVTDCLVVNQTSEENGMHFAAVLPMAVVMQDFQRIRRAAWLILFTGAVLEIGLGCCFALRYSKPIHNLIDNMQGFFMLEDREIHKTENISEYEYLEKGVHALLDDYQSLNAMLQEKTVKERRNFLTLLMNGEFDTELNIIEEAAHAGIRLVQKDYYALVFGSEEGEKLLSAAKKCAETETEQIWYPVDPTHVALLQYCTEENPMEPLLVGEQTAEKLKQLGAEEVYVGIGSCYTEKREIVFSYQQALYCSDKGKIEKQNVVEYSRELWKRNMPWYPLEMEEKLQVATKNGNSEQVKEIFIKIREENLGKIHLSANGGKVVISGITSTLIRMCNNMAESMETEQLLEKVQTEQSFPKALEVLETQFLRLCEENYHSRSRKSEIYYQKLEEYLEKNYGNPSLGVPMVAEEFGLSENYFSIFFKETMGKSFSSYLEKLRLEKAKKLIAEGKWDMETIAQMVGYGSSATFRRAFKRAYGIAPSAWKE